MMEEINSVYRTGPTLEIRLPATVSKEAAFLLVDVLDQLMTQLFEHYDHAIADEIMRLDDTRGEPPEHSELDFSDLPF